MLKTTLGCIVLVSCFACVAFEAVQAIGQNSCVSFATSDASFPVVANGQAASVLISDDEWPGVQRAAADFVSDIEAVTGITPLLQNISLSNASSSSPIIVGTLGRSSIIDFIVNNSHLDVTSINGTWESFAMQEVAAPLPGVDKAFVIIGSDKRGTIFAMYELSEQMGVSPWYW
jgi:hypothetical protein